MLWEDLILWADVPWFMLSPSPVSLAQYAILSWIVSRHLIKKVKYKRAPQLLSLIDGFMISAFFIVLTDAFWCAFCAIKWLPLFPGDLVQISSSFIRDVAASALFLLLIYPLYKEKVLRFSREIMGWILLSFGTQALWFDLAPSPAYTDYSFAWRHGYSWEFILGSFLLSHFIMRLPLWLLILRTLNRKTHNSPGLNDQKTPDDR